MEVKEEQPFAPETRPATYLEGFFLGGENFENTYHGAFTAGIAALSAFAG